MRKVLRAAHTRAHTHTHTIIRAKKRTQQAAGYKIKYTKSAIFLYASNEPSKCRLRRQHHGREQSNLINSTTEVRNCKTPLKGAKESQDWWRDAQRPCIRNHTVVKVTVFRNSADLTCSLSKSQVAFCRKRQADPKMHMEDQGSADSQTILKQKI